MRSRTKRRKNQKALNGIFTTVRPTSNYPTTYASFPEDLDDWSCAEWKSYYMNNKAIIGQQAALDLIDRDISSVGSFADAQLCKYDCEFMNFFDKEGLKGGTVFSKLYCAVDSTVDTVGNVVGSAEGISDFIAKVANSKLLIVGAGIGAYYLYNRSKNHG